MYSNLEKTYFPYFLFKFTHLTYLDVHLLLKDIRSQKIKIFLSYTSLNLKSPQLSFV